MDSRSGASGVARTGTAPLQAIFDDLCSLNGRISGLASSVENSADALAGMRPSPVNARGPETPPSSSRIGQMQDVLNGMRENMSVLENQVSRIQEVL